MNVTTSATPDATPDATASPSGTAASTRELLRTRRGSAVAILLLALAYVVQAIAWGRGVEPFDAPDEPEHIQMAQFIADNGRWPLIGKDIGAHLLDETTRRLVPTPPKDPFTGVRVWKLDRSHGFSVRHPYAAQPPLGYCGLTTGVVVGSAFGMTDMAGARVAAAIMGALGVVAAGLTVLRLRPDRPDLHLLAPGILAFLPQYVFVGSYVNPDVLGFSLCGVVLWRVAVGHMRGWSVAEGAKLGLAAGLALLAKASAVPVVGALAVVALVSLFRRAGSRGTAVGAASAALAAGAVVMLPWFAFLYRTYGTFAPWGDPAFDEIVASLPPMLRVAFYDGSLAATARPDADTWWKLLGGPWLVSSIKSSLAMFGWMDRPAPRWVHAGLVLVWGAGAAGLLRGALLAARNRIWPVGSAVLLACGVGAVAQLAASLNYSLRWDYQPQGRYLFPAVVCVAVLAAFGIARCFAAERRLLVARVIVLLCAIFTIAAIPYAVGPKGG